MAKEVFTRLIDDLDGGEAAETLTFGLDGYSYQIDLSTKNATKLRNALAVFVENGSRVSGRATAGPRTTARPSSMAPTRPTSTTRSGDSKQHHDIGDSKPFIAELPAYPPDDYRPPVPEKH